MKNPTLYLVMLMWWRQLQQCFFEKGEQDTLRDWNKYRQYYGTGTGFVSGRATLSNINLSTAIEREGLSVQKSQLHSSSLTQTTQLQKTTFVTENPPTPAHPTETVTKLPMNCS
jgi:hypothetical protein